MTWVTPQEVSALVGKDLTDDQWIHILIDHSRQLIEGEIGEFTSTDGLIGIGTQITARLWRASQAAAQNPAGNTQETLGPHNFSAGRFEAGWGLTRSERDQLRRFKSGLWVQPTTQADRLETGQLVDDTAGGDPILYYPV